MREPFPFFSFTDGLDSLFRLELPFSSSSFSFENGLRPSLGPPHIAYFSVLWCVFISFRSEECTTTIEVLGL